MDYSKCQEMIKYIIDATRLAKGMTNEQEINYLKVLRLYDDKTLNHAYHDAIKLDVLD
jgi:hypothetical protein